MSDADNQVQNIPVAGTDKKDGLYWSDGRYEFFGYNPMEKLCAKEDLKKFLSVEQKDFYIFGEAREYPICRMDGLPARWAEKSFSNDGIFRGSANPGEFFVFQIAVYANGSVLKNIKAEASGLKSESVIIASEDFRFISLGGRDIEGREFKKRLTIRAGRLQPLWVGVYVPKNAKGTFEGIVEVSADGVDAGKLRIFLDIEGEVLEDCGDSDDKRLSRLRWLDSDIGIDERLCEGFAPLKLKGRDIFLSGHKLEIDDNGLPFQIASFYKKNNTEIGPESHNLFRAPMRFVIKKDDKEEVFKADNISFAECGDGKIAWRSSGVCMDGLNVTCDAMAEYDGYISYSIKLSSNSDVKISDVYLEINHALDESEYFMGLEREGGKSPESLFWKWDEWRWQDGYWAGAVDGGIKIRFRDAEYRQPLVNCYYNFRRLSMPEAWFNDGKGGINIEKKSDSLRSRAFSGRRELKAAKKLEFGFDLWLTPFKKIMPNKHWNERITQFGYSGERPSWESLKKDKISVVNLHHAQKENPIINYPYSGFSIEKLKAFSEEVHREGLKLCLYYTAREITMHIPEFQAFLSMNGEIIYPSSDARPITNVLGAHPWAKEHLHGEYIPAWRQELECGLLDLAFISTPESRMENFYLAGLDYLLKQCRIDGLYLDDSSISRKGFQRVLKIFEANGVKEPIIDFHAWNTFKPMWGATFGNVSVLYRDCAILPYISRVWLGEGFEYDIKPNDYWLAEISGIPFGLMGETLRDMSPWRGLLYGISGRLGGGGYEVRPLWRTLRDLGILESEFIPYWDEGCPLKTASPEVLCSVYRSSEKIFAVLSGWNLDKCKIRLELDYAKIPQLGKYKKIKIPEIENLQKAAEMSIDSEISIEPFGACLITFE